MKRSIPTLIALPLILAIIALGTGNSIKPTANLVLSQSTIIAAPVRNSISEIEGNVQLKRKNWSKFQPIKERGTPLYSGDQLQLDNGAMVIVLCADQTRWRVPTGTISGLNNGCPPQPEPALRRPRGQINTTRSDNNPAIPYIISPRQTLILNNKPTLRWNAVHSATSYTVSISGLNWQTEVSGTQVVYPGNPPLEPEVNYLVVIKANNGKSSEEEKAFGMGFSLLNVQEAQRVRDQVERIEKQNLADEVTALTIAYLYIENGLRAEAIEILDKLVTQKTQSGLAYHLLGDLYWYIGLARLAEEYYLKSIELTPVWNIEGRAEVQAALGEVYAARRNWHEATRYGEAALIGYQTLGDKEQERNLKNQLDRWKRFRRT